MGKRRNVEKIVLPEQTEDPIDKDMKAAAVMAEEILTVHEEVASETDPDNQEGLEEYKQQRIVDLQDFTESQS